MNYQAYIPLGTELWRVLRKLLLDRATQSGDQQLLDIVARLERTGMDALLARSLREGLESVANDPERATEVNKLLVYLKGKRDA